MAGQDQRGPDRRGFLRTAGLAGAGAAALGTMGAGAASAATADPAAKQAAAGGGHWNPDPDSLQFTLAVMPDTQFLYWGSQNSINSAPQEESFRYVINNSGSGLLTPSRFGSEPNTVAAGRARADSSNP